MARCTLTSSYTVLYKKQGRRRQGSEILQHTQPPPPDEVIGLKMVMEMVLAQCSGSASQP